MVSVPPTPSERPVTALQAVSAAPRQPLLPADWPSAAVPLPAAPLAGRLTPAQPSTAQVLASTQLLGSHQAIEIDHNGQRYRLQSTRSGKLILTK